MTFHQSCSWCHTTNNITGRGPHWCQSCGHRADKCRLDCDCPTCRRMAVQIVPDPPADDDDDIDPDEPTPLESTPLYMPELGGESGVSAA